MAEVLGAVASASQLAALTMGLLCVVKKIKGGSETLRRYQQQLQEVYVLSESISRNPLLQTPAVDFHTRSILVNISQNNLEHRLRQGWLSRTCTFLYRDRDLADFFVALDRQKSSLSLVIEDLQSRALHQIQSDIRAMSNSSNTSPPFEKPSTPPDSDDEASPKPRPCSTEPQVMDGSSASRRASESTDKPTGASVPRQPHPSVFEMLSQADLAVQLAEKFKNVKGEVYHANIAKNGASLHLGATVDDTFIKGLGDNIELNSTPDSYSFNKVEGPGNFSAGVLNVISNDCDTSNKKHQQITYNASYSHNEVDARNEADPADPKKRAVSKMRLGPQWVKRDALIGTTTEVLSVKGMRGLGLDSDTTKDQSNTTTNKGSSSE